ncbi:hypothetical protein NESM_000324100 [Novymonas esmeraldas]|uniref:Uncharacterized protein n=1 Tax=Novymonas esmeraldas TaxID=1808958 RepID=A0AAW0ELT1_9TRYP
MTPTAKAKRGCADWGAEGEPVEHAQFDPKEVTTWKPWFEGKSSQEVDEVLRHIFLNDDYPHAPDVVALFAAMKRWICAANQEPFLWEDLAGSGRRMALSLLHRLNSESMPNCSEEKSARLCDRAGFNFEELDRVEKVTREMTAMKKAPPMRKESRAPACYNCHRTGHKAAQRPSLRGTRGRARRRSPPLSTRRPEGQQKTRAGPTPND